MLNNNPFFFLRINLYLRKIGIVLEYMRNRGNVRTEETSSLAALGELCESFHGANGRLAPLYQLCTAYVPHLEVL